MYPLCDVCINDACIHDACIHDACIHDACIHDVCTHDTNIHGACIHDVCPPAAAAAPPIESMSKMGTDGRTNGKLNFRSRMQCADTYEVCIYDACMCDACQKWGRTDGQTDERTES